MKRLLFAAVVFFFAMTVPAYAELSLGDPLPQKAAGVKMKNVDGRMVSINDKEGENGTLVIFACNHCPWVKSWKHRIAFNGNWALGKGIGVVMINPNDPSQFPEDDFDGNVQRAKDTAIQFPYVVDSTSEVARVFGAKKTPEFFFFNAAGKLVYKGALDDNADDQNAVKRRYVEEAVKAVLAGQPVGTPETKSIGCSIKYRGD